MASRISLIIIVIAVPIILTLFIWLLGRYYKNKRK